MPATGTRALADFAPRTAGNGWATGTAPVCRLRPAPARSVRGHPEGKVKTATPAFRGYSGGAIDPAGLRGRPVRDGNPVPARCRR